MTTEDKSAKVELRRKILARRGALPDTERPLLSARITEKIVALESYRKANRVLAYQSFGSEFMTAGFIARVFADGKTLVLPKINRQERRLDLYRVEDLSEQLAPGIWGILEPQAQRCEIADPAHIDLVLTPGLAFTARGDRLGYGGGFYDRLLAALNPRAPRVAAAFALQLCDSVPTNSHDQPVDIVITEDALYQARRGGAE